MLVPGAGVSPVGWQDDLRTVGSAMGNASAPDFSVSVFHEAMAMSGNVRQEETWSLGSLKQKSILVY